MARYFRLLRQVDDFLYKTFPFIVCGVSFPCKYKLNWPISVLGKFHDFIQLIKNQRGPFIGSKTPRKADGERIRLKKPVVINEIPLSCSWAINQASACKVYQFTAKTIP